jgi:hypothetical protein
MSILKTGPCALLALNLAGCIGNKTPPEFVVSDIQVKRDIGQYTQRIETSAIVKTTDSKLRDRNVMVWMSYTDATGSQGQNLIVLRDGVGQFSEFSVADPGDALDERAYSDFSVVGYVLLQPGKAGVAGAPSVRTDRE